MFCPARILDMADVCRVWKLAGYAYCIQDMPVKGAVSNAVHART